LNSRTSSEASMLAGASVLMVPSKLAARAISPYRMIYSINHFIQL
jgi:hypothetical protein